jgi:hypothetical protein
MGMRGRPLDLTVSVIATVGFLLFGYDRKSIFNDLDIITLTITRGCHVWYHLRGTFHAILPRNISQFHVARLRHRNLRNRMYVYLGKNSNVERVLISFAC